MSLRMHKRKHIRWKGFDYSSPNAYFITICVKNFQCVLGEIRNGIVGLSEIGNIAAIDLQKIPEIHKEVLLDEFIVMPNHVHCILDVTRRTENEWRVNRFAKPLSGSISTIINQFKGCDKMV